MFSNTNTHERYFHCRTVTMWQSRRQQSKQKPIFIFYYYLKKMNEADPHANYLCALFLLKLLILYSMNFLLHYLFGLLFVMFILFFIYSAILYFLAFIFFFFLNTPSSFSNFFYSPTNTVHYFL